MITFNPDLKIFYSTKVNDRNYFSGFSISDLGDARNSYTITNFFNQQRITFKKIAILEQIHSTNIELYQDAKSKDYLEIIADSDGILTKNTQIILVVRNADCVPLIMVDKTTGYIGISHQGWRGSLKNMANKMVTSFLKVNSKVEDLICSIGPAIGICCYEVDDSLYYNFLEEFDGYSRKIFILKKCRWHISLSQLNYLELLDAGIKKENIDFFPFCTKCDSKRFFSRRRAKSQNFSEMFNFVMKL